MLSIFAFNSTSSEVYALDDYLFVLICREILESLMSKGDYGKILTLSVCSNTENRKLWIQMFWTTVICVSKLNFDDWNFCEKKIS